MTVQPNLPPTNTLSDGVTDTFNYNFKILREEHLVATFTMIATGEVTDLEIESATGVGDDAGGSVTFATAPADGGIVTIDSVTPLSQIEQFDGNKLPPETVERMGDATVIQNQRQQSQIERSVRFPASDDQIPTLPAKAQRADKILGFTADGSDFLMVDGAAASQAYVDQAEAQADRAVAATTYPYTSGEQKTGAFMPGTDESLTLFTYNNASAAAALLPAMSGITTSYNIGIGRTAGSGDVTISADDGALINGASNIVLNSDYLCLDLKPNEAGDEWVARDKVAIGVPIGTEAGNIVALDDDAKLPSVDGSQLLNIRDNTARDVAITAFIKADIQANDPAGTYGGIISDNFISDSLATSTNAAYSASGDFYSNEETEGFILAATGTPFGDFIDTGGLAAAFNGVKSATTGSCAQVTSETSGYIGKDWGAGVTKTITRVDLYPSSDQGFVWSGGTDFEVRIYGSNSAPASPTDGTQLYSTGVISDQTTVYSITSGINETTFYRYHWVAFIDTVSTNFSVAEIDFYGFGYPLNMTLIPDPTALADADPSDITVYFRVEDIDSVTNGTDRIVRVSIDEGSTWAICTITVVGAWGADDTLIKAEGDVSGQSGSSFLWELTTANAKEQRIKQVASVPGY